MLLINPDLNVNSTDAEKYAAFVEAVVTGKVRYDWLEIDIFNDMKSNLLTNNPNLQVLPFYKMISISQQISLL